MTVAVFRLRDLGRRPVDQDRLARYRDGFVESSDMERQIDRPRCSDLHVDVALLEVLEPLQRRQNPVAPRNDLTHEVAPIRAADRLAK